MGCPGGPTVAKGIGFGGLLIGAAAGAALHKFWPNITGFAGPYAKAAAAKGSDLFDKGRGVFSSKPERFSDVIDEIKKESSERKKPGKEPEA